MKIKINLKEIREEKEFTQSELAIKAGVSLGIITRIEQDLYINPPLIPVLKLSKALEISITDLIEIIEE